MKDFKGPKGLTVDADGDFIKPDILMRSIIKLTREWQEFKGKIEALQEAERWYKDRYKNAEEENYRLREQNKELKETLESYGR